MPASSVSGEGGRRVIAAAGFHHEANGISARNVEQARLYQPAVHRRVEIGVIGDIVDMAVNVVIGPARLNGLKHAKGRTPGGRFAPAHRISSYIATIIVIAHGPGIIGQEPVIGRHILGHGRDIIMADAKLGQAPFKSPPASAMRSISEISAAELAFRPIWPAISP